ncbi:MAG TPA: hypothetical protein VIO64_21985 [Pseudobacteroides sp.]|uniref:hypothetical protein n=1 Tax=Pseudobacteroides sp. TaxID=1968840 RepID=UPI002F94BC47
MKKHIVISVSLIFIAAAGLLIHLQLGQNPSSRSKASQGTSNINTYAAATEAKKAESAALIGNIVKDTENIENAQNYEIVKKEIDQKIQSILNIKSASSNPYDIIKDNKDFEYLIQQKDAGLRCMLDKFRESNDNGLKEYIMAIACSKILDEDPKEKKWSTGRGWYDQYTAKEFIVKSGFLKDIYIISLDSMMPVDDGLNSGMKYIAIDGSKLRYINSSEKSDILKHFNSKYNVKALDASYDKLVDMGMVNSELNCLDGILLNISKIDVIDKKNVIIEGYKYKSGLGAVGVKSKVTFEGGEWKLESSGMTWIS